MGAMQPVHVPPGVGPEWARQAFVQTVPREVLDGIKELERSDPASVNTSHRSFTPLPPEQGGTRMPGEEAKDPKHYAEVSSVEMNFYDLVEVTEGLDFQQRARIMARVLERIGKAPFSGGVDLSFSVLIQGKNGETQAYNIHIGAEEIRGVAFDTIHMLGIDKEGEFNPSLAAENLQSLDEEDVVRAFMLAVNHLLSEAYKGQGSFDGTGDVHDEGRYQAALEGFRMLGGVMEELKQHMAAGEEKESMLTLRAMVEFYIRAMEGRVGEGFVLSREEAAFLDSFFRKVMRWYGGTPPLFVPETRLATRFVAGDGQDRVTTLLGRGAVAFEESIEPYSGSYMETPRELDTYLDWFRGQLDDEEKRKQLRFELRDALTRALELGEEEDYEEWELRVARVVAAVQDLLDEHEKAYPDAEQFRGDMFDAIDDAVRETGAPVIVVRLSEVNNGVAVEAGSQEEVVP